MNPLRLRSIGAGAASAVLLLALAACASSSPGASASPSATASAAAGGSCAGVTVVVDPGALKVPTSAKKTTCVPADGPIVASEAFKKAGVTTVGTTQYGDQVVCRVNGVPAADFDIPHNGGVYHEACQGMPAAFAYWALWLKPAAGAWAYAQEGLTTQKVEPGQSVELLFTLDGKPAAPTT